MQSENRSAPGGKFRKFAKSEREANRRYVTSPVYVQYPDNCDAMDLDESWYTNLDEQSYCLEDDLTAAQVEAECVEMRDHIARTFKDDYWGTAIPMLYGFDTDPASFEAIGKAVKRNPNYLRSKYRRKIADLGNSMRWHITGPQGEIPGRWPFQERARGHYNPSRSIRAEKWAYDIETISGGNPGLISGGWAVCPVLYAAMGGRIDWELLNTLLASGERSCTINGHKMTLELSAGYAVVDHWGAPKRADGTSPAYYHLDYFRNFEEIIPSFRAKLTLPNGIVLPDGVMAGSNYLKNMPVHKLIAHDIFSHRGLVIEWATRTLIVMKGQLIEEQPSDLPRPSRSPIIVKGWGSNAP